MIKLEESYFLGRLTMDWDYLGDLAKEVEEAEDISNVDLLYLVDDWLSDISFAQEEVNSYCGYSKYQTGDETDIKYLEIGKTLLVDYILPFIKEHGYAPDLEDIPEAEKYVFNEVSDWKWDMDIDADELDWLLNRY